MNDITVGCFVRYRLNNRRIQLYSYIGYCLAEVVFTVPGDSTIPIIYIIGTVVYIVVRDAIQPLHIVV